MMNPWGVGLNRSEQRVLSAIIAAVRQRRARETSRLLWRIAPVTAAVTLLLLGIASLVAGLADYPVDRACCRMSGVVGCRIRAPPGRSSLRSDGSGH